LRPSADAFGDPAVCEHGAVAHPDAQRPIAVFDSGVGGLTVLHELLVQLPHEDFVYLGDTARFPYGDKSAEDLQRFALQIAERQITAGAKMLVVACNAATSAALPALRALVARAARGVDLVAVVEPESRLAVEASLTGHVGLLATPATVSSGAYANAVARLDSEIELTSVPCPDLAPIIQGGSPFDEALVDAVRSYCDPLRDARVDTVILGCTHYPLIRPILQRTLGRGVRLVFSGDVLAAEVERRLAVHGLLNGGSVEGRYRFECTGDPDAFRALGTRFLQMPLGEVVHVELDAALAASTR